MKDMTRDEALENARKWVEHHGTETRAYGPSERHMETAARIIEALTADLDRLAEENERLRAELTWMQVQASESGLKPGYELGQILAEIDDRARAALVQRY
jgi:hypothetical protein